jgi:hypothetical protein
MSASLLERLGDQLPPRKKRRTKRSQRAGGHKWDGTPQFPDGVKPGQASRSLQGNANEVYLRQETNDSILKFDASSEPLSSSKGNALDTTVRGVIGSVRYHLSSQWLLQDCRFPPASPHEHPWASSEQSTVLPTSRVYNQDLLRQAHLDKPGITPQATIITWKHLGVQTMGPIVDDAGDYTAVPCISLGLLYLTNGSAELRRKAGERSGHTCL